MQAPASLATAYTFGARLRMYLYVFECFCLPCVFAFVRRGALCLLDPAPFSMNKSYLLCDPPVPRACHVTAMQHSSCRFFGPRCLARRLADLLNQCFMIIRACGSHRACAFAAAMRRKILQIASPRRRRLNSLTSSWSNVRAAAAARSAAAHA